MKFSIAWLLFNLAPKLSSAKVRFKLMAVLPTKVPEPINFLSGRVPPIAVLLWTVKIFYATKTPLKLLLAMETAGILGELGLSS